MINIRKVFTYKGFKNSKWKVRRENSGCYTFENFKYYKTVDLLVLLHHVISRSKRKIYNYDDNFVDNDDGVLLITRKVNRIIHQKTEKEEKRNKKETPVWELSDDKEFNDVRGESNYN